MSAEPIKFYQSDPSPSATGCWTSPNALRSPIPTGPIRSTAVTAPVRVR